MSLRERKNEMKPQCVCVCVCMCVCEKEKEREELGLEGVHNGPWLHLPKDSEIMEATNPIRNYYLVKIFCVKGNNLRERG